MDDTTPSPTRRIVPATIAGLIFIGLAALYATGRQAIYEESLRAWGRRSLQLPVARHRAMAPEGVASGAAATLAVLAVLWAQGWRNWIAFVIEGRAAVVSLWVLREALWWWTITMMVALVVGLLARSEMGRRVLGKRL